MIAVAARSTVWRNISARCIAAVHIAGIRVDLAAGDIEHRQQLPPKAGERTQLSVAMRVGLLAYAALDRLIDEADGSARPARRRTAGPVPEADAIEIPAGRSDDVVRGDLEVVERCHCGQRLCERRRPPSSVVERHPRIAHVEIEQMRDPLAAHGHQRPIDDRGAGAERLRARQDVRRGCAVTVDQ